MIGLPYGEINYDNVLSRFRTIPERNGRTDRWTDGQTDRFAMSTVIGFNSISACDRRIDRQTDMPLIATSRICIASA